jgi:DNA-binding MarR family transcriptional regulator/N-acetylglutamate synthase-like GNAT family acetyltransferase
MAEAGVETCVAAVRRFNRFYTQRIGVLEEGLLESSFSLAEARVLYELAQRETPTAREIGRTLGLDPGYLSRILRRFEKAGLVEKERSAGDGRQFLLRLSDAGRQAFAHLDARSATEIGVLLEPLSAPARRRLLAAMTTVSDLLGAAPATPEPFLLRPHRPGDMGWIVHRHAVLYAEAYGWDESFEQLVAEIAAEFLKCYDPKKERCWIAEREGGIVGSVALVRQSETVAKLRLLLVEPEARGLGLGRRLVEECLRFARQAGYRQVTLWTQSILTPARRLYESVGFRLVGQEPRRAFGHDLVSETWEMTL